MNAEKIFSTKERVKILDCVIFKHGHFGVSGVADEVRLSKGLVSKYMDLLAKEGILERSDGKFVVKEGIETRAVRVLLSLGVFDSGFFRKHKFVRSAGLYGSAVKGTNTEKSDMDLWLVVENVEDEKLAGLTAGLKNISPAIRPLYLTREKLAALKKDDVTFYHALVFGSIVVYGEGIETV